LEEQIKGSQNLIDRHLRVITVTFSLVAAVIIAAGLVLSGMAIYGKIEVGTATRELERKFEVLAGQALKAPVLKIEYEEADLDRRALALAVDTSGVFRLGETQLNNVGDGATSNVSVRLYFSQAIEMTSSENWQRSRSSEKDFPSAFFWGGPYAIGPREKWVVDKFLGKAPGELPVEMRGKIKVFYGREQHAEATFTIRLAK
jgi:hypothetical protein